MKRFLLLLSVLVLLPLCALAVTSLPATVTEVEDSAFAGTDIDALIVPASVEKIGAPVLAGSDASYIYLNGARTTLADEGGVPFVFGPASSPAAKLSNFYDSAKLVSAIKAGNEKLYKVAVAVLTGDASELAETEADHKAEEAEENPT